MGADDNRPRRGFWRTLGRGVRKVARAILEALDVLDFLVLLVRVIAFPFRVLMRALDALW